MVTKFSMPFPWPNFLSARAAQLPSLSTHTGRWSALERGVRMSTELHSFISLVEWRTIPSCGFTRPPVLTPERNGQWMSKWIYRHTEKDLDKRRHTDTQDSAVEVNGVSQGLFAHGQYQLYPLLKRLRIQLDIFLNHFTLKHKHTFTWNLHYKMFYT